MYNNIAAIDTAIGSNFGGIASFLFVPKEWLDQDWSIDVITGTVKTAPTLLAGRAWIPGAVMSYTGIYTESPKTDKAGDYIEGTLTGIVYKDETARAINLATLRFHELVVIYTDINKQRRIIGNKAKGMTVAVGYTTGQKPGEASVFSISLTHQMAEPAPIYEA